MIVDLIRHGEPVGGRRYRGHGVDDELSETGWLQMREAVSGQNCWQNIVSSPMIRCSRFAEELADKLGAPLQIDQALKEIGFGAWEGFTPQAVEQRWPAAYSAFYRDPVNERPEGAEPVAEFSARVIGAFQRITVQPGVSHQLVVAHAGVIRAIVSHVLEGTLSAIFRIKVPYAGVTRIQVLDQRSELVFHAGRL